MITIRPIQQEEIPAVKLIIFEVAYHIFGFDGSLEDSIRHYGESGTFEDMNDVKACYDRAGGRFLVVLDSDKVIGSGAMRRLDRETAELKRMWLLEEYHGQGIGYSLTRQLFTFAREQGYLRVRLQTSPSQTRALSFYRKLGFYQIPCYNDDTDEISMEIQLNAE
jgi:putative acetyltransferase